MPGNACCYSVQNILSSNLLSKTLKIKIYRIIIFPVVLYGCETWSLTLREKRRLQVFENRVLRTVFGPKRDEVGEWRKLHNEELRDLYSLPNIVRLVKSRRMDWAGYVARMGSERGVHRVLVGKSPYGGRFSAPVQTGFGAHPARCTMGTGSFPGIKSGLGVTLTRHPLLVPWS